VKASRANRRREFLVRQSAFIATSRAMLGCAIDLRFLARRHDKRRLVEFQADIMTFSERYRLSRRAWCLDASKLANSSVFCCVAARRRLLTDATSKQLRGGIVLDPSGFSILRRVEEVES